MNILPVNSGDVGGEPSVEDRPPTTEGEKWTFLKGRKSLVKFELISVEPDAVSLVPAFWPFERSGESSGSPPDVIRFTADAKSILRAGDEPEPSTDPGVATVLQDPGLDMSGGGTERLEGGNLSFFGGVRWPAALSPFTMISGGTELEEDGSAGGSCAV